MKKHAARILLFLLLCACLSSCKRTNPQTPITVNGTPLNGEIFSYFLYEAYGDPAAADKSARVDDATRDCIRYLAINTAFASRQLRLSPGERVKVSEETNALWRIFGAKWEAAGISKETIYKLRTSHAYGEKLRTALFDVNGEKPIGDEAIWAYYTENYLAVRYLEGVPPAGEGGVQAAGEKLNAAFARMNAAAEEIGNGATISDVYRDLREAPEVTVKQSPRIAVFANGDPAYPQEFYAACVGIEEGRAAAFVAGNSVYLAQREPLESEPTWYLAKRAECFKAVSEPYWQNELNALCGLYSAVRHAAAVERCCETVAAARSA